MPLPETDVARVERFCRDRYPAHVRYQVFVAPEVTDRHITIMEVRAPYNAPDAPEERWTRFPIARLRYVKTKKLWGLYWRDRNMRFHRYEPLPSSPQIQTLLDWIGTSGDPIFWG